MSVDRNHLDHCTGCGDGNEGTHDPPPAPAAPPEDDAALGGASPLAVALLLIAVAFGVALLAVACDALLRFSVPGPDHSIPAEAPR